MGDQLPVLTARADRMTGRAGWSQANQDLAAAYVDGQGLLTAGNIDPARQETRDRVPRVASRYWVTFSMAIGAERESVV